MQLVLVEVVKSSDASFGPLGRVKAPALVVSSRTSAAVNAAVALCVSRSSLVATVVSVSFTL